MRATFCISASGTLNASLKAFTSSSVTRPSALAILAPRRNQAHGECDLISSRPILFLIPIDSIVSRHAAEQRADRAADRKAGRRTRQFSPNRHHPFPKWTVATAYDHSLRRARERRPTFLRLTRLFESLGIGSYHSRN